MTVQPQVGAAVAQFMNGLIRRNPGETELHQAVEEFTETVMPFMLEQSQNALRISWGREEVDHRLRDIMRAIHRQCAEWGADPDGRVNYVRGANLAGFTRVAAAMLAYGIV